MCRAAPFLYYSIWKMGMDRGFSWARTLKLWHTHFRCCTTSKFGKLIIVLESMENDLFSVFGLCGIIFPLTDTYDTHDKYRRNDEHHIPQRKHKMFKVLWCSQWCWSKKANKWEKVLFSFPKSNFILYRNIVLINTGSPSHICEQIQSIWKS